MENSRKASIIAIDGPVAAGKSVVGRLVARRLGCRFLDTGAMYRAITWVALKQGTDIHDEEQLGHLAERTALEVRGNGEWGDTVLADGCDVTEHLRRPDVEWAVSIVSRCPSLRRALVERQRALAAVGRIVIAGRDIGTVVVPQADLKVFLQASIQERAKRRHAEEVAGGRSVTLEQVRADLERRDALDSGRAVSPLRPASDAHLLDTDGLDVEQVVERILALVEE